MSDAGLIRLLELVREKLGAADARVEIGGREPEDPRVVSSPMSGSRRMVLVFDAPVDDRRAAADRLAVIVASFATTSRTGSELTISPTAVSARAALDDVLAGVATRAGALQALVVDVGSPVLWGSSHEEPPLEVDPRVIRRRAKLFETAAQRGVDVPSLLASAASQPLGRGEEGDGEGADERVAGLAAELERIRGEQPLHGEPACQRLVLATRAIAFARALATRGGAAPGTARTAQQRDGLGTLVRSFGGIYLLVLVFDGPFSELRAQKAVGQALRRIEQLVMKLPPVDPRPGARVVRLSR